MQRVQRASLGFMVGAGALALAIVLTALNVGRVQVGGGYDAAVRAVLTSRWWQLWSAPPIEIALIAVLAVWLVLGWRRWTPTVSTGGRAWAVTGLAVLLLAVCSPLDAYAHSGILAAHMGQHVLIGAVAPLMILVGLPAGDMVGDGRLGRLVRRLCHPGWAFTIWTVGTAVWLLPPVHHQVLTVEGVWVLQQICLFLVGAALWAPVVERPASRPAWFRTGWKSAYMVCVWFVGLLTANVLWFSGTPFYPDHAAVVRDLGMNPLQDQANAGTTMMLAHCLLSFGAMAVLFFRAAGEQDGDLPESGVAAPAGEPAGDDRTRVG